MGYLLTPRSSPDEAADYLELRSLVDPDHNSSALQLISDVCLGGEDEGWEKPDSASKSTWQQEQEGLSDGALTRLEERREHCTSESYPFEIKGHAIRSTTDAANSLYGFLLLLSFFKGKAPDHKHAAKMFEEVAANAAAGYISADSEKETFVFGFPRRVGPDNFKDAVSHLCSNHCLKEGSVNKSAPRIEHQKDGRLDVVAWKQFPDMRRGRIIVYGQCATGEDWEEKAFALRPESWREKWLTEPFLPHPLSAFFVPHFVPEPDWKNTILDGGLLFDRFRIAATAREKISQDLAQRIAAWNQIAIAAAKIALEIG
jgi:hypothetical protein